MSAEAPNAKTRLNSQFIGSARIHVVLTATTLAAPFRTETLIFRGGAPRGAQHGRLRV